jgi:hypothetical protein
MVIVEDSPYNKLPGLPCYPAGAFCSKLNTSTVNHHMAEQSTLEQREQDLTIHVFSISAAMVGVCLTAIGILRLVTSQPRAETIGDELLAADSVMFMLCCFLSFWSLKTASGRLRRRLRLMIDGLFILALSIMVAVCAIIAYAIA